MTDLVYIPGALANVCLDCGGYTNAIHQCPCGSGALYPASKWLNREAEPSGVLERMTLREFQELGSTGVTLNELDKAILGREN